MGSKGFIKKWDDLESFFRAMNAEGGYIVMRNYEELFSDFEKGEHQDIDFLCVDRPAFISAGGCAARFKECDLIHRVINVGGRDIPVDVRTVGDGYYDTCWEEEMIKNSRMAMGVIPVPSEEDYFYSLLYHALIQKKKIAEDYKIRLKKMADDLGGDRSTDADTLLAFMKRKGYYFTYPENPKGIFNTQGLPAEMIKPDKKRIFLRKLAALF